VVVIILERVPTSVRGELTRWLLEPKAGVFVGRVSGMVRDKLWEMVCGRMGGGAGMMLHTTDSEQGFAVRLWGTTSRIAVDYEGLSLIARPAKAPTETAGGGG
jgi:CRISPR-associated protein Cas2